MKIKWEGWREFGEGDVLLNLDGNARLEVVDRLDIMSGTWVATVLYQGWPVLVVESNKYEYQYVQYAEHDWNQAMVAFMELCVGELAEGATEAFMNGDLWDSLFDEYGGEGHELIAFVGVVAQALYRAHPDDLIEPKGF